MAWGRGATVARADVEFNAETGQAELDIKRFSAIVEKSVDDIGRHTRAGALAWEKYERAMAGVAPDSYQARRALVALERELAAVRREATRATAETNKLRHHSRLLSADITRTGRGAIAASGAFKGLGNALFFASGAFAGGFGLIYALRTTIQAAGRAQVATTKLSVAVRNAGIDWRGHRKEILDVIEAQSKLTSFDDEELKESLSRAVIRTKDLSEAYRLNAIAADYARASGRPLEQAMTLVTRASLGQTASLRRLGIDAQKVTTEQDKLRLSGVKVTAQQRMDAKALDEKATRTSILGQIEAKVSGQAAAFALTAEGRQQRFNKVLEDTQEIIGLGLLPTINGLLTQFTEWLDKENKTGQTQKTLNKLLDDTGDIAHAVAGFFGEVKDILGPVNDLFGGTYETTKLIIELWAGWKIVKVATAVRGIATAWGLVGPAATTAAAETVIAETAIGTGATKQLPKIAALAAALRGLTPGGAAGVLAGPVAVGAAVVGGIAAIGLAGIKGLSEIDEYLNTPQGDAKVQDLVMSMIKYGPSTWKKFWANMSPSVRKKVAAELRRRNRYDILAAVGAANVGGPTTVEPGEGRLGGPSPGTRPEDRPPSRPKRSEVDVQLDLARAQAQGNEAAEIRFHRELIAMYQRRADRLEVLKKQGKLTLLQKQQLTQLYTQIESETSAVESIISGQQSDARARSQAAATAAREKHDRHKTKVDTHLAWLENQAIRAAQTDGLKDDAIWNRKLMAGYRAAAHDEELTAKEREAYEKKRLTARGRVRAARTAADEVRQEVKERKLINAVAAAELTDGIKDDAATLKKLIAYYKAREHNADLSAKARQEARTKELAAQKKLKKLKDDDGKKGGAQSGAEFLSSLQGVLNTYGGNLFAPGELKVGGRAHDGANTAHTILQTSLMRDQNRILTDLGQRVRTPASSQGYTNMTSLFDGYATA